MHRYYAVPLSVQKSYAYPVARVRALESRLIDRQRIDRMLDAPTLEDAVRVLSETDYGAPAGTTNPAEYDRLIAAELGRAMDLVAGIVPQPQLVRLFRIDREATAIKALLRARSYGDGTAATVGSIEAPGPVRAAVASGDVKDLPWPQSAMVAEGLAGYAAGKAAWEVESRIDALAARARSRWARELRDPFIRGAVEAAADVANIVTFLRSRAAGAAGGVFARLVLREGAVSAEELVKEYERGEEGLEAALAGTPYRDMVVAGLKGRTGTEGVTAVRALLEGYMSEYVQRARMIPGGPAPVFAYLTARLREARAIRTVFEGRLAALPQGAVRERLGRG